MADYTIDVRGILESMNQMNPHSSQFSDIDSLLNLGLSLFDNYPIWNEEYRDTLNKRILSHFFMREIGYETVSLWRFALNRKLNEIMPYYNKMYEVASQIDSPLTNYDGTQTGTSDSHGTGTSTQVTDTDTTDHNHIDTDGNDHLQGGKHTDKTSNIFNTEEKWETDDVHHTGWEHSNTKETMNDEVRHTGWGHNELKHTGKDTLRKDGTETDTESGGHTLNKLGTQKETRNLTTNSNDTPQGSVTIPNSKYLTNSTNESGSITTTFGDEAGAISEKTTYNDEKSVKTFANRTDTTEWGHVETTQDSLDKKDKTTHGSNSTTQSSLDKDDKRTVHDKTDGHTGEKTTDDVSEDNFTTNEQHTTSDSTGTVDTTVNGNTTNDENTKSENKQTGRYGISQSKLFSEFAEALVNIDMLIINELEELFMQIF